MGGAHTSKTCGLVVEVMGFGAFCKGYVGWKCFLGLLFVGISSASRVVSIGGKLSCLEILDHIGTPMQ